VIELSTCHKVHLPPQFGLSSNPLTRGVLCESQQDRGFGLASPGQELRTVDGPLPLYGVKLRLAVTWAFHVLLFDIQRLDHVCFQTAIVCCCATTLLLEYILSPQFLSTNRACQLFLNQPTPQMLLANLPAHVSWDSSPRPSPMSHLGQRNSAVLPSSEMPCALHCREAASALPRWRGCTRKLHMELTRTNSAFFTPRMKSAGPLHCIVPTR